MTEVSVATWNLHQAIDRRAENMRRTWRYLEEQLAPTIALVQEAAAVPKTPGGHVASRAESVRYETAVLGYGAKVEPVPGVVTRYSRRHTFPIEARVPGTFAAARLVDPPEGVPFVAISMYGLMSPVYAQTAILRALADLIPLFDAPDTSRRVVLGGDLNVYDQTDDRIMAARWRAILDLIETLGLVNLLKLTQPDRGPLAGCPCRSPDCWHVETFRHRNRPVGRPGYFTLDYLFASPELADRLVKPLEVWATPEAWELSDHCPVLARFEI